MTNDEMRPTGRGEPDPEDSMSPRLEQRLEAYARARLAPDPEQVSRLRTAVMAQAQWRLAQAHTAPAPIHVVDGRRRLRLFPALLAAGLAILVFSSVAFAGSQPGGPLYGTRLWLEEATLPTAPAARLEAQLQHLQARLDEASAAAASRDGGALQAALEAYRQALDETIADAGGNVDRLTRLVLELGRHEVVLGVLSTSGPAQAQDAIKRALERANAEIQQIRQQDVPGWGPGNPSEGPGLGPAGKPSPAGGPPSGVPGASSPGGGKPSGVPGAESPAGGPPAGVPGNATSRPDSVRSH